MKNKKDRYPLDIFSVKELGLEKWIKNEMIWPILDDESIAIGNDVYNEYVNIIRETKDERIKLLLNINNKLILEISGIIHSLLVLKRLDEKGLEPEFNNSAIYFEALLNQDPSIDGIYNRYKDKVIPENKGRLYNSLKGFLLKLKLNKSLNKKKDENVIYSLESKNHFYLKKYSQMENKPIKFYPLFDISTYFYVTKNSQVYFEHSINEILRIFKELGLKYEISISEGIISNLKYIINNAFTKTNSLLDYHYSILKKLSPSEFFIPSLGHISFRTFSAAAKLAGHTIIGSSHGNSIGMFDIPLRALIDLSIVDKFLVVTNYASKNYKKLRVKYLEGINRPEIISVNSNFYKKLFDKHNNLNTKSNIKKLMIVEYPLTETRHNLYSFWPYQLKLMLKIGQFLSKTKINSIIKRHPDRLEESTIIYKNYYDYQLSAPFEEVFQEADAFLFMNITSTTFGFAMTTNRPIFIFSTWLEEVWDEMVPAISKRCITIPSWIDSSGVMHFDEKYFRDKLLSKGIWEIDNQAVNDFMIP